jgi:hypothetical protein
MQFARQDKANPMPTGREIDKTTRYPRALAPLRTQSPRVKT